MIKGTQDIYLGTRDGLKGENFWQKVNDKDNLLMVFKSKNGYIFGAYSPSKWLSNQNLIFFGDHTLSSFIFSQTHDKHYPLKNKDRAIYCDKSYGPVFGDCDIYIEGNFINGCSHLGNAYQFDQYKGSKHSYLFGQEQPEILECEIYQLNLN